MHPFFWKAPYVKQSKPSFQPAEQTRPLRKPGPKRSGAEPPKRFAAGTGSARALLPTLEARFDRASEFVEEYADNISQGGIFLRGEYQVARLTEVQLALSLPGTGEVVTPARVVHNTGQGIGLELSTDDEHFYQALREHLILLGRRRQLRLVACDMDLVDRLNDAGYEVAFAASPTQVVGLFARGVNAVVVDTAHAEPIEPVVDRDFLVLYDGDFDQLLHQLDRQLP